MVATQLRVPHDVTTTEVRAPDGRVVRVLEVACPRQDRDVPLSACLKCPAFARLAGAGCRSLRVLCDVDCEAPPPVHVLGPGDVALMLTGVATRIARDATLEEAAAALEPSSGRLWVTTEDGALCGLLSIDDIDCARVRAADSGEDWRIRPVAGEMRPAHYWVSIHTQLRVVSEVLARTGMPAVPVLGDDGAVMGEVAAVVIEQWLDAVRTGRPLHNAR